MDHATYRQQRFMEIATGVPAESFSLLGEMSSSLGQISSEVAGLRNNLADHVSLQQQILQRDQLQQHLEEVVYQGQKMVGAFAKPADRTSPVEKALLLRSFLMWFEQSGIGTEAIRGLQNKKAFDSLMSEAKLLYKQIKQDHAVRRAIASQEAAEEAEQARLEAEEQARREAEEQRQRLALPRKKTLAQEFVTYLFAFLAMLGLVGAFGFVFVLWMNSQDEARRKKNQSEHSFSATATPSLVVASPSKSTETIDERAKRKAEELAAEEKRLAEEIKRMKAEDAKRIQDEEIKRQRAEAQKKLDEAKKKADEEDAKREAEETARKNELTAAAKLKIAKKLSDPITYAKKLKEIVEMFPETEAAKEAQTLLKMK